MSRRYLITGTILELYTPLECFLGPVNRVSDGRVKKRARWAGRREQMGNIIGKEKELGGQRNRKGKTVYECNGVHTRASFWILTAWRSIGKLTTDRRLKATRGCATASWPQRRLYSNITCIVQSNEIAINLCTICVLLHVSREYIKLTSSVRWQIWSFQPVTMWKLHFCQYSDAWLY